MNFEYRRSCPAPLRHSAVQYSAVLRFSQTKTTRAGLSHQDPQNRRISKAVLTCGHPSGGGEPLWLFAFDKARDKARAKGRDFGKPTPAPRPRGHPSEEGSIHLAVPPSPGLRSTKLATKLATKGGLRATPPGMSVIAVIRGQMTWGRGAVSQGDDALAAALEPDGVRIAGITCRGERRLESGADFMRGVRVGAEAKGNPALVRET